MSLKLLGSFIIGLLLYKSAMSSVFVKKFVRNLAMRSKTTTTNTLIEKNDKPPFILLASVGNPEKTYKGTRHSVGHLILKEIAQRQQFEEEVKYGNLTFYSNRYRPDIMLYESTSFMNTSGKNIKDAWNNVCNSSKLMEYNPVLVVLHDELELSLGKIKVRRQMSSHKGHNGLRSINNFIGGGFIAISIGISRPESRNSKEVADYVLSRFPSSELQVLKSTVVEKVETVLQQMLINQEYIYDINENYLKKLQK